MSADAQANNRLIHQPANVRAYNSTESSPLDADSPDPETGHLAMERRPAGGLCGREVLSGAMLGGDVACDQAFAGGVSDAIRLIIANRRCTLPSFGRSRGKEIQSPAMLSRDFPSEPRRSQNTGVAFLIWRAKTPRLDERSSKR